MGRKTQKEGTQKDRDSYGRGTPDPKDRSKGGKQMNQSEMNNVAI